MIDLSSYRENIYQNYGLRECPHYGEDGVILKIFEEIEVSNSPQCVEFGELRVLGTTTRPFRIAHKAKAIYFSGTYDFRSFYLNVIDIFRIIFITKSLNHLKFLFNFPFKEFATVENIESILSKNHVDNNELDIICVDIDSYDYYIVKKLLDLSYRPKLFIVEYNPSFGKERKCSYPLKPAWEFSNPKMYGASYALLNELFDNLNYKLCFVSGFCNLFYIREDFAHKFSLANIGDEITDTDEKINDYLNKYCQKGFAPTWMNAPPLTEEDFSFLDHFDS